MTYFEQWFKDVVSIDEGDRNKDAYRRAWNAAIASMRGDAKFNSHDDAERLRSIARGMSYNDMSEATWKHVILEIAMRLDTGGYNQNSAASKIADQDARIKELEQQLSAAWIPMSQQRPIEEHGYKVLGFGDGYVFECEYELRDGEGNWCNITGETMTHWMPLPPNPDAAIRQIGGAE